MSAHSKRMGHKGVSFSGTEDERNLQCGLHYMYSGTGSADKLIARDDRRNYLHFLKNALLFISVGGGGSQYLGTSSQERSSGGYLSKSF